MMARNRSFQNEIPPSRVNIRYVKYTGGAQEKVELPLKLLLLGDYTLRPDDTPLEERKKIGLDKDNFDAVLKEQKLRLSLLVPNRLAGEPDEDLEVKLDVDSLQAFSPDELVRRVPQLAKMLEIRDLLTDLKARVITNRAFRLALEKIVRDPAQLQAITHELDRIAPVEPPK
ncbi:MAG TPA: type VI secretion system contractile sheath small subunit [Thermoanaerobaculia bacterium]|nr:type VI secretion system contractile sheath small subunit [Thermoanaerobaculia bacterium]